MIFIYSAGIELYFSFFFWYISVSHWFICFRNWIKTATVDGSSQSAGNSPAPGARWQPLRQRSNCLRIVSLVSLQLNNNNNNNSNNNNNNKWGRSWFGWDWRCWSTTTATTTQHGVIQEEFIPAFHLRFDSINWWHNLHIEWISIGWILNFCVCIVSFSLIFWQLLCNDDSYSFAFLSLSLRFLSPKWWLKPRPSPPHLLTSSSPRPPAPPWAPPPSFVSVSSFLSSIVRPSVWVCQRACVCVCLSV